MHLAFYVNLMEYIIRDRQAMDIPNVARFRIAIALAILKHKPPSESCYAYVLDLRSIFSFASRSNVANVGDLWRNHALNLEKNYAALKTHFECKGIRSFISLNSTPESDLGPKGPKSPQRSKDGTDGIKKKGKKKVITDDPDEHFSSHHANDPIPFSLKDFCNDLYHVDCKNLFICLDIFPELTTLIGRPNFPLKSFLSATSRILDEISASFNQVVKGIISFDILGRLEIIARLVIEKSLLAIFSANFCPFTSESTCNPFTPLLEMLITRLLVSITHSFFLISSQWLHCLSSLASTNNCHLRQDNIDLRPAVLAFFHSILRSLHQWIPPKMAGGSAHTSMRSHLPTELLVLELSLMRHSLILEILRYLEKNLLDNSGNPEPRRTIQSRIMRLAVKDTLWYICSALHTVIDLRPEKESLSFNGDITSDIYEGHHRHLNLLKDAIRKLLVSILVGQERQCSSMSSSFFLGPPTPIAHSNYMEPPEVSTPSSVHDICQNSDAISINQNGDNKKALLLDDAERRMLLRVFESYVITS